MGGVRFDSSTDIPSLSGKIILVTGANSGLGKQSILELSKHSPTQIWLAARNLEKANKAAVDVKNEVPGANIKVLELDLGSLISVQRAAATFRRESSRLDILMLNAGIMAHPPGVTNDGYEIQFGTNHVGHALLVKLLLPALLGTAELQSGSDVRVILLSSSAHTFAPKGGIQFQTLKSKAESIGTVARYGQSKLANILFAKELSRRHPQLKVVAVHPGVVSTNLANVWTRESFLMRIASKIMNPFLGVSVEEGVKNQLWASAANDITSGEYYEPVGAPNRGSKYTKDSGLAKELWEWTSNELRSFEAAEQSTIVYV